MWKKYWIYLLFNERESTTGYNELVFSDNLFNFQLVHYSKYLQYNQYLKNRIMLLTTLRCKNQEKKPKQTIIYSCANAVCLDFISRPISIWFEANIYHFSLTYLSKRKKKQKQRRQGKIDWFLALFAGLNRTTYKMWSKIFTLLYFFV